MPADKPSPEPYWQGSPTPERVAAFANEAPALQLQVLNRLRSRSSDAVAIYLGAAAIGIAFVTLGITALADATPLLRDSKDYIELFDMGALATAKLLSNVYLGFYLLIFVGIAILGAMSTTRIQKARVLLSAYEAELERRWAARGWRARRWQREHSPDWDAVDEN